MSTAPLLTPYPLSLSPSTVTRPQFQHLLSLYPRTIRAVYTAKLRTKQKPKPNSKPGPGKGAASKAGGVEAEVEELLGLDEWRYEEVPRLLAERREVKGEDEPGAGYLEKEELERLVAWKL